MPKIYKLRKVQFYPIPTSYQRIGFERTAGTIMIVANFFILLSITLGAACLETDCKPLVRIPGGDDQLSRDPKASKVTNITLDMEGHIIFNGKSSIDILALAGAELGQQFFLKFVYKISPVSPQLTYLLNGQDRRPLQPLVANCENDLDGWKPSIWIFVEPNRVEMGVKAGGDPNPVALTLPVRSGFNTVTLKYDGQYVVARANDIQKTKPLTGDIESRNRGIVLGQCSGIPGFVGAVDEMVISKCLPSAASTTA